MQKISMRATNSITFQEGCEKYFEYCRQRILREGTIDHYRQSYKVMKSDNVYLFAMYTIRST